MAPLDVTVVTPSGKELTLELSASGADPSIDTAHFQPPISGRYRFQIAYGGESVPGSPFLFDAVQSETAVEEEEEEHPILTDSAHYLPAAVSSLGGGSRASSVVSSNGSLSAAGDHQVVLTGKGLAKGVVGLESEFVIDGSRAGPGE